MPLLASGDQVQENPALQTPAYTDNCLCPLGKKFLCFLLPYYRTLTMHFINMLLKKLH